MDRVFGTARRRGRASGPAKPALATLATLIAGLLAAAALVLAAAGPADSATPARVWMSQKVSNPGWWVKTNGSGFPAGARGQLFYGGNPTPVATFTTTSTGTFAASWKVPGSAKNGQVVATVTTKTSSRSAGTSINLQPEVFGPAPANGSTTPDATPEVSVVARDRVTGANGAVWRPGTELQEGHTRLWLDGQPIGRDRFVYDPSTDARGFAPGPLPNGAHQVRVEANDGQGGIKNLWWTFKVAAPLPPPPPPANTEPEIINPGPAPDSTTADPTPEIRAVVRDGVNGVGEDDLQKGNIRLWLDGRPIQDFDYDSASTDELTYAPPSALSDDAVHRVRIEATDSAGATTAAEWGFTVRTSPAAGVNAVSLDTDKTSYAPNETVDAAATLTAEQAGRVQEAVIAVRKKDSGAAFDFPVAADFFVDADGERLSGSRAFAEAGTYEYWVAVYEAGAGWRELTPRKEFTVGAAPVATSEPLVGFYIGFNENGWLTRDPTDDGVHNDPFNARFDELLHGADNGTYDGVRLAHAFGCREAWTGFGCQVEDYKNWVARDDPNRRFSFSMPLLPDRDPQGRDLNADRTARKAEFREVIAGHRNEHFRRVAASLAGNPDANGRPTTSDAAKDTIVRLGWEFNGDTFPWRVDDAETMNLYKEAWAKAAYEMNAVEPSLEFEWCPNISTDNAGMYFRDMYPTDDTNVDYLGLGFYDYRFWNRPAGPGTPQQRWGEILRGPSPPPSTQDGVPPESLDGENGLNDLAALTRQKGKKIGLTEHGLWNARTREGAPTEVQGGGDDPYFIQELAAWMRDNGVEYFVYNDVDNSRRDGDGSFLTHNHRLDDHQDARRQFVTEWSK